MSDTRQRIVEAAADLIKVNGYNGTGLKQIATGSGAPTGSLYHFFPGGKDQLMAEALRLAGAYYQDLVMAVFDAEPDPHGGIEAMFSGAAAVLEASDYADACPIATVALEVASTNDALRQVTNEVFERWIAAGGSRLGQDQRDLAIVFIALLEGAFLLCRAAKSTEAMHVVGRAMATVFDEWNA